MPDEPPDTTPKNVPLIPAPEADPLDDAAEKESALMSQGKLDLVVQGCVRSMKAYTITSTELEALDVWGVIENRAYTTAFSLWSFSVGLLSQAIFSDFGKLPALAQASCYLGIPGGAILGFVVFRVAKKVGKQSKGIRDIIEGETAHNEK